MVTSEQSEQAVWKALGQIRDPEIPALSIIDLKIVRHVAVDQDRVAVEIIPTYAACPALDLIKQHIQASMSDLGFREVDVRTVHTATWSTDLLDVSAREELRRFGIAPPTSSESGSAGEPPSVTCPFCNSDDTVMESSFGSTLCKQLFFCQSCRQSFEHFKPL